MYKGIYIALTGTLSRYERLEKISHNIANANTAGFKQIKISFDDYMISQMNNIPWSDDGRTMTVLSKEKLDLTDGEPLKTGNPLDIAINGKGFLSLEGNLYSRRGDLKRDSSGFLMTKSGNKVLGEKGPIKLPEGVIEINPNGEIFVNSKRIDRFKIVEFDDPEKIVFLGNGLFSSNSNIKDSDSTVLQGHIEQSNVDVFKEMIEMISALRDIESYQKAMQTFDEATSKVTNDMAKI
jgi:flagellar basal-body rod protein FlgG